MNMEHLSLSDRGRYTAGITASDGSGATLMLRASPAARPATQAWRVRRVEGPMTDLDPFEDVRGKELGLVAVGGRLRLKEVEDSLYF